MRDIRSGEGRRYAQGNPSRSLSVVGLHGAAPPDGRAAGLGVPRPGIVVGGWPTVGALLRLRGCGAY